MTGNATTDLADRIAKAMKLHHAGRSAEAEAAYKSVLTANPKNAGVLHNLGVIAAEAGRRKEAIGYFDRAIVSDPQYASAHFNKANALRALGHPDAAVVCYRQTVALVPDHYEEPAAGSRPEFARDRRRWWPRSRR